MNAGQYHDVLVGLDRVLDCFDRDGVLLTPEDIALKHALMLIRARVLKFESGHPFPATAHSPPIDTEGDPAITAAPWQLTPRASER